MNERWMKSDEPKEGGLPTWTGWVLPAELVKTESKFGMAAFDPS